MVHKRCFLETFNVFVMHLLMEKTYGIYEPQLFGFLLNKPYFLASIDSLLKIIINKKNERCVTLI